MLNVIGIKIGRFRTIQRKLKEDQCLKDKRGKSNKFTKFTDELKQLIREHCESLPHSKSHYTDSQLNYFNDSSLTLKSLYDKFIEYYKLKTGTNCTPLTETTYSRYFYHFVNFTFDVPRTDVCNICYQSEQNGKEDDPEI